jgi:hypothetical protein
MCATPPTSLGRQAKRYDDDPARLEGLHPSINDPNKLKHFDISGTKYDDTGKKMIPEVLNRNTVFDTIFKGQKISEDQMFRRIKTISPTHNIKFRGIAHAHIQTKLRNIDKNKVRTNMEALFNLSVETNFAKNKPIMLTPFEV